MEKVAIICPVCTAQKGEAVAIELDVNEEASWCPNCQRSYRVLTREVSHVDSRRLESGHSLYRLTTIESGGRQRARLLEAQRGVSINPGSWVTIVWRGRMPIGIADHARHLWQPIEPAPRSWPGLDRFLAYLAVCAGLLALLQLVPLIEELSALSMSSLVAMGIVAGLLAGLPTVFFAVQTFRGDKDPTDVPRGLSRLAKRWREEED